MDITKKDLAAREILHRMRGHDERAWSEVAIKDAYAAAEHIESMYLSHEINPPSQKILDALKKLDQTLLSQQAGEIEALKALMQDSEEENKRLRSFLASIHSNQFSPVHGCTCPSCHIP